MLYITIDRIKEPKIDFEEYKDLVQILKGVFKNSNKKVIVQKTLMIFW